MDSRLDFYNQNSITKFEWNKVLKAQNVTVNFNLNGDMPFLLVEADDGHNYQIKIPNPYTSSMHNEYIANFLCQKLYFNTPIGRFIKIDKSTLEIHIHRITQEAKPSKSYAFEAYDYEKVQNENGDIVLFGTRWIDEAVTMEDEKEFDVLFDQVGVMESLYSVFPLDLYLHNHDRHIGNVLFYANGESSSFLILIDHDKIFGGGLGIEKIGELANKFECNKNYQNNFLYKIVTEAQQKNKIMEYSKQIESLDGFDIEEIFQTLVCTSKEFYDESTRQSLIKFLKDRKASLVIACKGLLNDIRCYS